MKLLMISGDRTAAAGKQGAFWYTLEELSTHWERIDVICPKVRNSEFDSRNSPACRQGREFGNVFFHSSPKGLWYQKFWIQKKGAELLKKYSHQVITSHDYPPFYNAKGALALKRKFGVPVVSEVHHIVGLPVAATLLEYVGKKLSRWYLPQIAKQAAAVRVVNSTVQDQLISWGIAPNSIHVVPSFYLDPKVLQPVETEKRYDVVFVGRLVANKGIDKLLVAMNALPGASLLIIGEGAQRKHYEQLATNIGIADRVYFAGWLPSQTDVLQHMLQGRVFVMPSSSEGGPRSALEAMACGLPVVATQVGVMPDVIENGENGLFTSGTAEDIAEKVALLLSDDGWRQRIGQNATGILQQFNRVDLIRSYAEFLQSVAK